MINQIELESFGPLEDLLNWRALGKINLIIGNNGCGKSFLLKALYITVRALEEYKRGNNPKDVNSILADKLHWTFQAKSIGELVSKQSFHSLSFKIEIDNRTFLYSFGKNTTKSIKILENDIDHLTSNSIFLPAKEVLSLHHLILQSRASKNQFFGFDDTYLDLAQALTEQPVSGRIASGFSQSRQSIENMIGGKIKYDEKSKCWQFKNGRYTFPIGTTAEGIKKIAVLETLLGNRYLTKSSIIFIDEPESTLHPEAISEFLNIITMLAKEGIQFFIASHSYFVVKKLFLIAQEQQISIPVLSYQENEWLQSDLKEDLPDNPIIDESIRLYEQQLDLAGV